MIIVCMQNIRTKGAANQPFPFLFIFYTVAQVMNNQSDPNALEQLLCFNVYSTNLALSRFYKVAFGKTGMTYPKFVVLSALEEAGALTVSELSKYAGMESSTLSPLLKRMADYGVLSRTRSAEDERRVMIALTDMGREAVALVREVVLEGLKGLNLDPPQTAQLVKMLGDARARIEGAEPTRQLEIGRMPPPLPEC